MQKDGKSLSHIRSSVDSFKKEDFPGSNYLSPQNVNPYIMPQNYGSIHYDHSDTDRPRSNRMNRNIPPPTQGYGMPQFIPVYMPMNYGYPQFPQPYYPYPQPQYNYGKQYQQNIAPEDVELDKSDRISKEKNKIIHHKSSEQIIAEFKSQTLPKLRLKRLVKMQAVMRGYHVRKFKIPKMRRTTKLYREVMNKKIEQFLEDKIIPDIVLEVIATNKYDRDYTLYSHALRNQLHYIDNMIEKVVLSMSKEIVKETTSNIASEFLKLRKSEPLEVDTNPFSLASKDVLHNYVQKMAEKVAREAIDDMVTEYLMESQLTVLFKNKYIPKIAEEAVQDAVMEVAIEEIMDDKLEAMIRELAPAMIETQYEELVTEATINELEKGAQNHIRRLILDVLLDNLRTMVIVKSEKEEIADSAMRHKNVTYMEDDDLVLRDHDK